jgi:hypothetical protein
MFVNRPVAAPEEAINKMAVEDYLTTAVELRSEEESVDRDAVLSQQFIDEDAL